MANIQSRKGFSIIQVVISMAIAMISGLAIVALVDNTLKVQKGMEITDDLTNMLAIVKMSLGTEAVCNLNISNFKNPARSDAAEFNSADLANVKLRVDKIQNSASNTILTSNQSLPGKQSTLVKIHLTNLVALTVNSNYIGELQFELDKNNSSGHTQIGVKNIIRKIPINIRTTNVGTIQTITSCVTPSSSLSAEDIKNIKSEMCSSLNGTFDPGTGKCDIGPFYQ